MPYKDPKTGRFTKAPAAADASRPVQMVEVMPGWRLRWYSNGLPNAFANHGETPQFVSLPAGANYSLLPIHKPKPDPHGPRIDAWLVALIVIAVVAAAIAGIAFAGVDGGLL